MFTKIFAFICLFRNTRKRMIVFLNTGTDGRNFILLSQAPKYLDIVFLRDIATFEKRNVILGSSVFHILKSFFVLFTSYSDPYVQSRLLSTALSCFVYLPYVFILAGCMKSLDYQCFVDVLFLGLF